MSKRDYYEVLGLERDASESAIKGAYRKKALKYHPDRNPGDSAAEEQFKEASEAYEVLSDPDKKAAYDRFGHAGIEGNFGSGGFQWTDFTHAGDFQDIFGDIFESFFGGGRRSRGSVKPKGRDLKIKVALTLEEIAEGVEKNIALTRLQRCKSCEGTGAASGAGRKACGTCGGRGSSATDGAYPLRAVDDRGDVSDLRRRRAILCPIPVQSAAARAASAAKRR